MPRPPVGVYIQTSRRRVRKRARRRDVVDAPVATRQAVLTVSQKSSSRARRSVPYSRPAVRLLKRAVDAVNAAARTATHCQREADWARGSFTSSVTHSTPPPSQAPTTAQHSPPSARSLLVRAVPGLPRRYVAFPLPMVQGACCCVATSPGAYASRASATAALNVLSGSWLVL